MKCLILASTVAAFLVGCASARTASSFKYVRRGMSESEVVGLLGAPAKKIQVGEKLELHYRLCDRADLAWCADRYADDYWVELEAGKVTDAKRTSTDGATRSPLLSAPPGGFQGPSPASHPSPTSPSPESNSSFWSPTCGARPAVMSGINCRPGRCVNGTWEKICD